MVTIPNSRFLVDIVASGNSGNMDMMIVNNFYIAIDADLEKAETIVKESIMISEFAYLKKPISIVISEIIIGGIIALELKAKSYVIDVKYEKAFQSDIVRKVRDSFNESKIKRPIFNVNYVNQVN